MSLTEFVGEKAVKDRIGDSIPNQGERAEAPLQAEWVTRNYMLVGTAFDYLLRFWLRKNVDEFHARSWVAETSLEVCRESFPEAVDDVGAAVTRAEKRRDDFIETGQLTRPLVESAIDLARIDGIYRGGELPTNLGEYDDGDIVDLLRLVELLEETDALTGTEVYLNPAFGIASALVGGADADVVLDGSLVDVKTTGKATFKVDYWRQLVGYLVLADVHQTLHQSGVYDQVGLADDPDFRPLPDIDSFGVYFARHGVFSAVSASAVYEAEGYNELKSWFVHRALDEYQPFGEALEGVVLAMF